MKMDQKELSHQYYVIIDEAEEAVPSNNIMAPCSVLGDLLPAPNLGRL